ncbi:MAG: AgmX/PglI C-terminal domain-containing protein, partial [Deltaproteobacteria bacterium]|nr:AgmX/PglI C-terminal domain-containing protein [Deltaproteobacteria bacterium]
SLRPEGEAEPARCVTAIEAKLYCEGLGKRLPTAAEWEAALGDVPLEADEDSNNPFTRGPFAEWTMAMTHGTPTFEIRGAVGVAGAPEDLKPDQFSDRVSFRCAFTFGPPADVKPQPPGERSAKRPERDRVRKTDSLFAGRLYIDRIVAGEGREGIAAAVAAKLAERFDKHFGQGVVTSSEFGSASRDLEQSTPAERLVLLAEAAKASRVLFGELVDIEGGLWVNLAFYDAKQERVVDRISERAGTTPESVLTALERGLDQILLIPVGEKGASKELIIKLIHSKIGLVKHCYDEALQRKPKLAGKISLELTISAEGVFDAPGIVADQTTLDDATLHRCVIDGLSGIETGFTFEGATTAHYPFEFQPDV